MRHALLRVESRLWTKRLLKLITRAPTDDGTENDAVTEREVSGDEEKLLLMIELR